MGNGMKRGRPWYNLPREEHRFSEGGEDLIMCRHSRVQDTKYATQLQWGLLLTQLLMSMVKHQVDSDGGVNC